MNVLEKILEEIERLDDPYFVGYIDRYKVKEIIRSHMDGISKTTDVQEVEGIDVDNAIRILKDMQSPKIDYAEMVGAPAFCYGKRYVFQDPEDYAIETALAALNEKKERDARRAKDTNIHSNDGWIPVEERLPEVPEGLADEYCPEFNVTIKGAERTTTLKYSWDGTWFDDNGNVYNVIAWQPLPKQYKPKKQD